MQQFTVPQFIDVEDKIIGPITARQFVIMLAGSLLIAICYKVFDFSLFLTSGLFIFACCAVLAFVKVNGMPFHFFMLNFFQTLARPNLRVWYIALFRPEIEGDEKETQTVPLRAPAPARTYTASRLAELSLIVDTQGAFKGEDEVRSEKLEVRSKL